MLSSRNFAFHTVRTLSPQPVAGTFIARLPFSTTHAPTDASANASQSDLSVKSPLLMLTLEQKGKTETVSDSAVGQRTEVLKNAVKGVKDALLGVGRVESFLGRILSSTITQAGASGGEDSKPGVDAKTQQGKAKAEGMNARNEGSNLSRESSH